MNNFGLPCQHDLLRNLNNDGPYARLNPAEIHAHWFLYKAFVPVSNMSDGRNKVPVTKRKAHSTRILTAEERSNKRQTRCSVCREYGHNKSRYAKRIIVANNHARQQASQVGGIGIITYFSN